MSRHERIRGCSTPLVAVRWVEVDCARELPNSDAPSSRGSRFLLRRLALLVRGNGFRDLEIHVATHRGA